MRLREMGGGWEGPAKVSGHLRLRNMCAFRISVLWDVPGGPVLKTLYFQCRVCGFHPW